MIDLKATARPSETPRPVHVHRRDARTWFMSRVVSIISWYFTKSVCRSLSGSTKTASSSAWWLPAEERSKQTSKTRQKRMGGGELLRTCVSVQGCDQRGDVPHGLVDAVAVLQRRRLAVELLGQAVEVGEAPQQVLLARLPELRVAHEALHQVQPAGARARSAVGGEKRR